VRALPSGTVTLLFTDIEGSTRLLTELGAEYQGLIARHHALIREEIVRTGGAEVKTEGDAFFVAFATAPSAVACAIGAQRAIAAEPWSGGHSVRVRIGIHTGQPVLADGDYVGLDVHRAARICAAAHGGQVVISDSTRALAAGELPGGVSLRTLGEHRLKDLPEPMRLHQLVIEGLAADYPPLRSLGHGNLPEPASSFVGREAEIDDLARLTEGPRLVTVTGPGGAGKTRVVIEVARRVQDRFADGAWFVPLDTITDPDLVVPAIARALAVREQPGGSISDVLADSLANWQLMLVLDNIEQVISAAPQIARLLASARDLRVICSSREALHLTGEQEYALPPLEAGPSVRLFIDRARQLRPGWQPLAEEAAAIAEICRALDGLPLAIELAAARIRVFSPRVLLARLTDRLDSLGSGARDVSERQRTLRGAIEWSHDLLIPTEQELFARLAVFSGGASISAMERVVAPDGEVTPDLVATISSLVEKSLLRPDDDRLDEPRFRMLETIRAYAAERLTGSATEPLIRNRHARFYLDVVERLMTEVFVQDPGPAFDRLAVEHDNIRAAIEWSLSSGQPALGLRICAGAWRFWQQRGHLTETRPLLERLLAAHDPTADGLARALGLTAFGGISYWQGDHPVARTAYEEALDLSRAAGDEGQIAIAEYNLGWMLALARDSAEASRLLERSSARYRRLGDPRRWLIVDEGLAMNAMIAGDLALAREIAERVATDAERLGMRYHYGDTHRLLTAIYLRLGDPPMARRSLHESAASLWDKMGDVSALASLLQFGAGLAVAEGRPADAARLLGALQGMRDRAQRFFTPSDVLPFPDPEPVARAALPVTEFEQAWREGRDWPAEVAVAFADRAKSDAGSVEG
jgi:predicted ATPase/class 3 adenylate cyclase